MKTKSFFILLLAVALCLYGCTKTEIVELVVPDNSTEEIDPDDTIDNSENNDGVDDGGFFSQLGDGTRESPYTVSQALELLDSGTYDPEKGYYVKGIVAFVAATLRSGEGYTISYYMSEGGIYYAEETSLFVDTGFGLGGECFISKDALSEGDKVIVFGKLTPSSSTLYHGRLYYLNGESKDLGVYEYLIESGEGTKESPYTVYQAAEIINEGTYNPNKGYYVKGIVSTVNGKQTSVKGGYGIEYYISECGGSRYYVTNVFVNLGGGIGCDFFDSPNALSSEDIVIVFGRLNNNDDVPEIIESRLYYLNGETGDVREEAYNYFRELGDGTRESPFSVPQVLDILSNNSYDPAKIYYVKGVVYNVRQEVGTDISYSISETDYPNYWGSTLYVFCGCGLGGRKFESEDALSIGDKVIVYGVFHDDILYYSELSYWNGETDESLTNPDLPDLEEVDDICGKMTDSNFIEYCLKNFDTNGDGKISMDEASMVATISCSSASDFAGIEYFTNLESFTADGTKYVDFSYNAELSYVYMRTAPIEQLDLSYNTKLTTIPYRAFGACSHLTSIVLPEGLTTIGEHAFDGCTSLRSVNFPNSLTTIESRAFLSCAISPGIDLSRTNVTEIGESAFLECRIMHTVDFPECLTTIGNWAFKECDLAVVSFPESLTAVGNEAFSDNYDLMSITIPGSSAILGEGVFSECPWLTNVSFSGDRESIPAKTFYNCQRLANISLPEGLISIGDQAFYGCAKLPSINLPDKLTSIGNQAFYECEGLVSVSMSENLTDIGEYAFGYCTELTSISIPQKLTTWGSYAFAYCKHLTSVSLPNELTVIGERAFYECTALTSLVIPKNLTIWGDYVFADCANLLSVTFPEGLASIGIGAFYGCTGLSSSITFPDGLTSIGSDAFYNCASLPSVTFPNSLTGIGSNAFYNCASLPSVSLPKGVTTIEDYTFYNCTNLSDVAFSENLTSIGSNAFYNCVSLPSISLPDVITTIESGTFYNCTNLTLITFPDGLTSIGDDAFYNCVSLPSVIEFPDGMTDIGNNAFYNCTSLKSLSFQRNGKSKIKNIGTSAFEDCKTLETVSVDSTSPASLGTNAFSGISSSATLYVPESKISTYKKSDWGKYFSQILLLYYDM